MELEQESVESLLVTRMDFLNPRDVQAAYIINGEYYILLTTGINLMVKKKIYDKAIIILTKYYKSNNEEQMEIEEDD
jgi:hypothetical protein